MKTLIRFSIVCCLSMVMLTAFAQNRYWVFPPNYIDFYTGLVLPLPNTAISPATTVLFNDLIGGSTTTLPGTPLNKSTDYTYQGYRTSNGVFNSEGELQFYLNNKMYATMGRSVLYTDQYKDEHLTIPVPGKCDSYFLIHRTGSSGGQSYILFKEISLDGATIANKSVILPLTVGAGLGTFRYALAPMKYNSSTGEPEMKLYAASIGGNPSALFEILVKEDGMHLSQTFATDAPGVDLFYLEMEASLDGRWIAWTSPNFRVIYVYDLQDQISYRYQVPVCQPMGIEFSPSSDGIFFTYWTNTNSGFTCSSSLNKLGYFNLSAGTRTVNSAQYHTLAVLSESEIQLMPGTSNLTSSFIEYAVDGLMYISDGTNLKGFDPLNFNNGFIKSYSMPNALSSYNHYGGANPHTYYTLIDQIDGMDQTRSFQIGCEISKTISGVTSADGSLTPIAKVSETLQTASTVTVTAGTSVTFKAGEQIFLKSGFTVSAGGNFRGRLEACEDLVIDYCSGVGRLRSETIKTEVKESFVNVFPNTTSGIINVQTGQAIALQRIDIITAEGKQMLTQDFTGQHEAIFDLGKMPDGVYILQIKHQNGLEVRRVILIR